jgi:quinol monooxygenase YgiN
MSHVALCVRFTLRPGAEEAFDAIARETAETIRAKEPGTLVYVCSEVDGAPNQRIVFELYTDRDAFDEHRHQPHIQHFLAECEKYAESTEIDRLQPYAGKYPGAAE